MMANVSGGAGNFVHFDLNRVKTPAFVVDEVAIRRNLELLKSVSDAADVNILLALKAFSFFALAPLISDYLHGTCASGLWEARLARKRFGGSLTTFSPAYKASEFDEICDLSDHLIFNSPHQSKRFLPQVQKRAHTGLRINPEHSEGHIPAYDPSVPKSRLGWPISTLKDEHLADMSGMHIHNLCQQNVAPLIRTWQAIEDRLSPYFDKLTWLNLGGGHHITRSDYDRTGLVEFLKGVKQKTGLDLYLEPGEAIALNAGILVGEVLDVTENQGSVAILDISATCHMPDVIEAPYRPNLLGERGDISVRIGGPSCLSGDVIGDYNFGKKPQSGDRIAFLDQAHYSMVKTNTFNGVALPSLYLWNSSSDQLTALRHFEYSDFEKRLG